MKIIFALLICGLLSFSLHAYPRTQENHFMYEKTPEITRELTSNFYRKAVAQLPIVCVDIFLVNPITKEFFLIFRNKKPVQGIFWVPGGRIYKGESFFECAQRKCNDEIGIKITPQAIVNVYSTVFPDSSWDCPTHTINIVVLAYCDQESILPKLDHFHSGYKWVSIYQAIEDPYIEAIRLDTLMLMQK